MQTLSKSPEAKALRSNALASGLIFTSGLIKFASLTRTHVT